MEVTGGHLWEAPRADTTWVAPRGRWTAPLETQAGSQPPQPHLVSCAALGQFPSLTWVSPSAEMGTRVPSPAEAFEVPGRDVSAPPPPPHRPPPGAGAWPRQERRWGPGSQEGRGCPFMSEAAGAGAPAAGPLPACMQVGNGTWSMRAPGRGPCPADPCWCSGSAECPP